MKSIGIVRRVDELGRIVIPKEMRTIMNIKEKDPMEFFVNADQVILRKYAPACIFCGEMESVVQQRGKNVCQRCMNELARPTAQP